MTACPWLSVVTGMEYCIDNELWKAIEYLKERINFPGQQP